MDAEMQALIAEMRATAEKQAAAATAATTAANAATAAANASTAAVHQVSRDVIALRRDLGTLWRKVNGGSNPPPLGDPDKAPAEYAGDEPLIDLVEQAREHASEASLEVAALEGRMIGALATVKREIMGELKEQSKDLGVGTHGTAWYRSKTGRREAIALLTLIVSGLGIIAATIRGTPPPPAPAPAPTYVIAAPAPSPAVSR